MTDDSCNEAHKTWLSKVATAEESIPLIGRLYRERNVVTSVFGRTLVNTSAIDVVKAHRWARRIADEELSLSNSLLALQIADELGVQDTSLDLGALAAEASDSEKDFASFARTVIGDLEETQPHNPQDIVLYGFGRIGRLLARILIAHQGSGTGMRLRAIVVRNAGPNDLTKRASLLRRDSVHGAFEGTIEVDEAGSAIIANGTRIQVIYSSDPSTVDYTDYGIDNAIVVDNTGRWRDEAGLEQHLQANGVSRVVLTAPGKGGLPNVVFGINHDEVTPESRIVTAASCTTNAITPVLKVINEWYGIEYGHVETVHSYTNDQNLIDNYHKGDRRGRSAALNMVLTETGAAKAVAKALPELEGKLTGNAIRVPTPDVSMAILNLTLKKPVDRGTINNEIRQESLTGDLSSQIDYIDSPEVVSTDFVGSNRAGIVDGLATIATDNHLVMYVWYDNEFGYSSQVIRVLELMAKQTA
ncbi:MAG TPA: glyceraldehyde-3-phosphate dehydrogenase [Candidatus Agrococcus pullicola]|uniref:Glyceraldehyde-3-phosphate dehydrogenase n=1 Tax=Candidatus Agrococcus pullicola TaxID=2838429 RepID=A0A9D1YV31_9MICO|nr:glyceraldehyde-3-phosphate dehydrogenase [Candidatus Agrococcus pullicola]